MNVSGSPPEETVRSYLAYELRMQRSEIEDGIRLDSPLLQYHRNYAISLRWRLFREFGPSEITETRLVDVKIYVCTCGNTADVDGFYSCDEDGNYSPWSGLYYCAICGRISRVNDG